MTSTYFSVRNKKVILFLFLPFSAESIRLHIIIESFRLEKTFKIIESNRRPNTAKSTSKPHP